MESNHFIPKIPSLQSSSYLPPNIDIYFRNKQKSTAKIINKTLLELFKTIEREDPLYSISKQVHLSETIELILGINVSEEIRKQRGFFLNLERAMIYFYLFHKIFLFFKNLKMAKSAYSGYKAGRYIFESIWKIPYPWEFARPARIIKEINEANLSNINKTILFQQKTAWKIAKIIEKDQSILKPLKEVNLLSEEEIELSGITGPILRSFGKVPSFPPSLGYIRKSSHSFYQFAFTTKGNLWNLLRVSYTELLLSLSRVKTLLEPYSSVLIEKIDFSPNTEITSTFPTALGQSHLSMEIANDKIIYFNYIPSEMSNMYGIMKILSTSKPYFHKLILFYLNPYIPINSK